ncbi:MAG: hypothetical protein GC145_18850 [Caulobacter sp.]|nr:hypothetical protein [Caulobacter sp.]
MLTLPEHIARYWRCGGEIFALGGQLPLSGAGCGASGCRVMARGELEALRAWHSSQLMLTTGAARHHHRLCLRDADGALGAINDAIDSHSRAS